jgi:3-deoxy-manno-octulosonate cytidylyltransferase (CMP-KDO synthetase)
MKIAGIIPARYASTRFPGKPLALIAGKPMIQHVWERASEVLDELWVATDDDRIAAVVRSFGGRAVMTSSDHPSGTDRCCEAMELAASEAHAVINIQGDEPFVRPEQLSALRDLIIQSDVQIASLMKKIEDPAWLTDPNKVKVVANNLGNALYFSRQAIPYVKGAPVSEWPSRQTYYKHLGLYAYKSDVLRTITRLAPSSLELAESLEQLRWLENGYQIRMGVTEIETPAVDTPEDLAAILRSMQG